MQNLILTIIIIAVLCAILIAMKDKKHLLNLVDKNKENSDNLVNKTLEYREKDLIIKEDILSTLKRIEEKINN